jgi:hypothetical protein
LGEDGGEAAAAAGAGGAEIVDGGLPGAAGADGATVARAADETLASRAAARRIDRVIGALFVNAPRALVDLMKGFRTKVHQAGLT